MEPSIFFNFTFLLVGSDQVYLTALSQCIVDSFKGSTIHRFCSFDTALIALNSAHPPIRYFALLDEPMKDTERYEDFLTYLKRHFSNAQVIAFSENETEILKAKLTGARFGIVKNKMSEIQKIRSIVFKEVGILANFL